MADIQALNPFPQEEHTKPVDRFYKPVILSEDIAVQQIAPANTGGLMKKFYFAILAATLLLGRGGATNIKESAAQFVAPRLVAILPMVNAAKSAQADLPAIRNFARRNLEKKGYALVQTEDVDAAIKRLPNFNMEKLGPTEIQQLGKALDADALLMGEVTEYQDAPSKTYQKRTVGLTLRLLDAAKAAPIFEEKTKVSRLDSLLNVTTAVDSGVTQVTTDFIPDNPMNPVSAAAVNKALRGIPSTPTGMPDFGGRTADEIDPTEKCTGLREIVSIQGMPAELGDWAGTQIDIFPESPVCFKPSNVANFDSFYGEVARFAASVRLAAAIVYYKKTGKKAANGQQFSAAGALMIPALAGSLDSALKLVSQGEALVASAPSQFTGMDALKAPAAVKALKQSLGNLMTAIRQGKAALADLKGEAPSKAESVPAAE